MIASEDRDLILDAVEKFCRDRLGPEDVRRRDEGHHPPYDLIQPMAEIGLIRAAFPESIGGLGFGWTTMCRVQERIGSYAYSVASILNRVVCFAGMPIMMFGTEAQKERWLPAMLDGQLLVALALSEPGVGSDASGVVTRCVRDGSRWRINGRKTWISDAGGAQYLLTLCRNETGDKSRFTTFLVPTDAPGVNMTGIPKVGNNCMPSFDIGYDDVLVDDEYRLGPEGEGMKTIMGSLTYSRASMSATAVGCARAAVDLAMEHARTRVQFKRPIVEFQVIKHRLVDMNTEVKKAQLLVYELARQIDAGEKATQTAAMAKLTSTETLQFVTDHGMQILASAGYSMESPMQRYWRDARLYSFGEGTNEIQREIIAKCLGLG